MRINGTQVGNAAFTGVPNAGDCAGAFAVGSRISGGAQHLDVTVADLILWNRYLAHAECPPVEYHATQRFS
jgi:hypothetical protein